MIATIRRHLAIRRLRKQAKAAAKSWKPCGTATYTACVHEPRPKPKSWSDKYYALSRWSKRRVSVSLASMDEQLTRFIEKEKAK